MEVFEFLCIKFHSSVRGYELLPKDEAKVAVVFPQHCHCGKRPLSTAPESTPVCIQGALLEPPFTWLGLQVVLLELVFGALHPPWLGQCELTGTNVSTTAQSCACMNNPARTAGLPQCLCSYGMINLSTK